VADEIAFQRHVAGSVAGGLKQPASANCPANARERDV
jgi:hypothetical protein